MEIDTILGLKILVCSSEFASPISNLHLILKISLLRHLIERFPPQGRLRYWYKYAKTGMPFRFYSSSCIPSAFGIGGVDISCMNELLLLLLLAPILIEMREIRQTIRINFYSILYYEIHCASVRPIFLTYMTGIYHLNSFSKYILYSKCVSHQ